MNYSNFSCHKIIEFLIKKEFAKKNLMKHNLNDSTNAEAINMTKT